MTNLKVRTNQIEIGNIFKKSESGFGTTTFKAISKIRKMNLRKNEYSLDAIVIASTGDFYKVGEKTQVYTTIRGGLFGKVTLIK